MGVVRFPCSFAIISINATKAKERIVAIMDDAALPSRADVLLSTTTMTSFFLKRSLSYSLKCFSSRSSSLSGRRAIHSTSVGSSFSSIYELAVDLNSKIVHKKAPKVDIEDLFGDETAFEPDLFADPENTITQNDATTNAKGSSTSTDPIVEGSSSTAKRHVSAPSDPFKRSALLNKHINFMKPRLGSSPSKKYPKIRSRTWLTLIQLAKNGEDMTKVVDLIPMLHEGDGALPTLFAEEFVREWWIPIHFTIKTISHLQHTLILFSGRCEQLRCQALALEVFGNYAKYNITLTPTAGRWLIHSVHVLHPLKDLLIAASLFSVYNISLAEDLVSASMFTAACFKHDTPQSRALANHLLPKIKTMVEEKKLTTPVSDVEMKRQLKWVDWSLRKINKFVKKSSGEPLVPLPILSPPVSQSLPSALII